MFGLCPRRGKAGRNASGSVYRRETSTEVDDQFQMLAPKKRQEGNWHSWSTYYVSDIAENTTHITGTNSFDLHNDSVREGVIYAICS